MSNEVDWVLLIIMGVPITIMMLPFFAIFIRLSLDILKKPRS